MKRISFRKSGLLFFATLLIVFSCKKDAKVTSGHLNLQFTASVGSNSFYYNQIYKTDSGNNYSISILAYYISNIRLVKDDGTEAALKDVVWVNYDNNSTSLAGADPTSNGTYFTFAIPSGNYKSLRFRLGLPDGMDGLKAKPSTDYSNNSALSIERGAVWTMDNTYRIVSINGTVYDQTFGNTALEYHLRTDSVYHEFEFPGEISVASGNSANITMNLDVARIFSNGANGINIYTNNFSDAEPKQLSLAIKVKNNFVAAMSRRQ